MMVMIQTRERFWHEGTLFLFSRAFIIFFFSKIGHALTSSAFTVFLKHTLLFFLYIFKLAFVNCVTFICMDHNSVKHYCKEVSTLADVHNYK